MQLFRLKSAMEIVTLDNEKLASQKALEVLGNGGLVIYPTETCYGVGVDATNEPAVAKLLSYKDRSEGKAISIAVLDSDMAADYVEINSEARALYQKFTPGPITIISKSRGRVVADLESELGTLGVRVPDHDFVLKLVGELGRPITATSANASGKSSPYSVESLLSNLSKAKQSQIDLIIDAGQLPKRPTSTVVDTTQQGGVVYRQGEVQVGQQLLAQVSESALETLELGGQAMSRFKGVLASKSVVFLLGGSLGAGKTHFVKGMAQELGIEEVVKSPSYTYTLEYEHSYGGVSGKLIHVDAWRLQSADDFVQIMETEWFAVGNVVAIEWSEQVQSLLLEQMPATAELVGVTIDYRDDGDRDISVDLLSK